MQQAVAAVRLLGWLGWAWVDVGSGLAVAAGGATGRLKPTGVGATASSGKPGVRAVDPVRCLTAL